MYLHFFLTSKDSYSRKATHALLKYIIPTHFMDDYTYEYNHLFQLVSESKRYKQFYFTKFYKFVVMRKRDKYTQAVSI